MAVVLNTKPVAIVKRVRDVGDNLRKVTPASKRATESIRDVITFANYLTHDEAEYYREAFTKWNAKLSAIQADEAGKELERIVAELSD